MSDAKFIVPGIRAGSIRAGIRSDKDSRDDYALAVCDADAAVAGIFTTNKVKAAPVILAERRAKSGRARAIVVNAGKANAMTGKLGMRNAEKITAAIGKLLGVDADDVLPASTGVIGVHLPVEKMIDAAPRLISSLKEDGLPDFSKAICTTDTVNKIVSAQFKAGTKTGRIVGCAKGAGMIAPNMATMLGFLFTDAVCDPKFLRATLKEAADASFNRITIDGDTSTNDTLFIMASGKLGNKKINASSKDAANFKRAIVAVCSQLAEKLVIDGEGATRIARIVVKGAASDGDAVKVARTIAESPLVKTALCGSDPNWGRIAAAAGRSGAKVDQEKLLIKISGIVCVKNGLPAKNFDEQKVKAAMCEMTVEIFVDLKLGKSEAQFLTCDFSKGYVEINAHYRT